jgi:GMP synthase-like glutamine amidotransferase
MNVRVLQHVTFESPGSIEPWARRAGHDLAITRLFAADPLPPLERVDLLIVMGGPMSVHDGARHPWLLEEKRFVGTAIEAGKPVLGVCLGAQIVADVLGAPVTRNPVDEIGWYPVSRVPEGGEGPVARAMPDGEPVFHWHGERFEIPAGAVRLARSEACENQAFQCGERVLGLQFHLEVGLANVRLMIENAGGGIVRAPTVQSAEEMLQGAALAGPMNARMDRVLDALAGRPVPARPR